MIINYLNLIITFLTSGIGTRNNYLPFINVLLICFNNISISNIPS